MLFEPQQMQQQVTPLRLVYRLCMSKVAGHCPSGCEQCYKSYLLFSLDSLFPLESTVQVVCDTLSIPLAMSLPSLCSIAHLSFAVVDKDVSCAVVFQVGDLQATGVANLGRLEGGIEGLNFHHCFGIPSLGGGGGGGGINDKPDIVKV